MPVPASGRLSEGLDAFDVTVKPPFVVLADVGENATEKLTLCPEYKVAGRVSPLVLKLDVAPTAEIVTLVPPEFVSVAGNVCELPTRTLPNARMAGLVVSWPGLTPAPDRGRFNAGLDAVDVMARVPAELPADVGENVVLKLTLWPGLKVTGKFTVLVLKPEVAPIAETVTLAAPELVSVSARV